MKFYNLKDEKMATLPYWEFENQYSLAPPGHSYDHERVKRLVHRKLGKLAGLHKNGLRQMAFLGGGCRLFNEQ
jgi:hypothetical protein